ncbi:MAG: L,D-transpeptidase [Thermoanaerobaculia bacterium]|nr:L,D-transpeptidase [Thermoanaerobaculia bacterium]
MGFLSRLSVICCVLAQFAIVLAAQAAPPTVSTGAATTPLSAAAVNQPAGHPLLNASGQRGSAVLRAQILLDRAHFSPGEIDGRWGGNTRGAAAAFNAARRLKAGAEVSAATWQELNLDTAPAIVSYTLTAEDLAGPFTPIPAEVADQAKLPALGFENLAEALGEKFHASPKLIAALNPGIELDRAGVVILVPNIAGTPPGKVDGITIRVDKSQGAVEAVSGAGVVLARYPATIGSAHDPLPLGTWKINGVAANPTFNYNPDLFWDAEAGEKATKLAPGPNGPVGTVWIDLSKPHYGIHGTAAPSTISKGTSHGCIRLTNWDVTELATLVTPGMPAILEE